MDIHLYLKKATKIKSHKKNTGLQCVRNKAEHPE